MRKKIKRIVPFILVGVLVSSFVMTNYNKAREAKAAFVVDDIALAEVGTQGSPHDATEADVTIVSEVSQRACALLDNSNT